MIYVCNIRGKVGEFKEAGPDHVYVGRAVPQYRLIGSPLANPHHLRREGDRQRCLEKYRSHLSTFLLNAEMAAELGRLAELAREGDLYLYCWCAPLACHADVIKQFIEEVADAP